MGISMKQKHWIVTVIILTIICVLLCGSLIVTGMAFSNYKKTNVEQVNTNPQSMPNVEEEETISMKKFKDYAQKYNVSAEFIQQFFDDVIVYKDTGIVYENIDESLPKHTYDFNNIVKVDGELQYHENGISTGIKGIDVSKYQGEIDWEKVKADGVEFAIIRLGYRGYETGKLMLDENYKANIEGATKVGIKVGVYFFSQAVTIEEGLEEAQMVLDNIKDYDITYPVIYDAEEMLGDSVRTDTLTTEERTNITIAFCEKIKSGGYKPMIYANVKWFVSRIDMSRLTQYDKWFAQYFSAPFFPYEFQIWQYTNKGKVDGIKGDVDLNISFKDYSAETAE